MSVTADRKRISDWATAYICAQSDPDLLKGEHPLWWAVEQLMLPTEGEQAEDCWRVILDVLSREPPEKVLAILAAGPLEDLIHYHGPLFIDRIEREARMDPAFRDLLRGVWEGGPPEVWARVQRAAR
jgi:hypothetical protein